MIKSWIGKVFYLMLEVASHHPQTCNKHFKESITVSGQLDVTIRYLIFRSVLSDAEHQCSKARSEIQFKFLQCGSFYLPTLWGRIPERSVR